MLAKVRTAAVVGLEGSNVEVEVDIRNGLPALNIVGLPDKAVQESKERVISAIKNSDATFPTKKIIVNLAPADLPKEGPSYDLPIAIGILAASKQIEVNFQKQLFVGELALDGGLRFTQGVLPIADFAEKNDIQEVFVPAINAREAALIPGIMVYPVNTLLDVIKHVRGEKLIEQYVPDENNVTESEVLDIIDFKFIRGQEHAKRAVEIAAAGGHNILMSGTPGSGKTMISRCIPSILPGMSLEESLEVTRIYSVSGLLPKDVPLIQVRPFRKPHHTSSNAALVGGGRIPKPGEISLAHRGVLFLDEFPEFPSKVLETLRQPLEDRVVTISRVSGTLTFPANFMLVAAMNPCKCGWKGDPERQCTCTPNEIAKYQKRISGPILDRIDLQVFVPRVKYDKLQSDKLAEPSEKIIKRVQHARDIQSKRFVDTRIVSNGEMQSKEMDKFCKLDNKCKKLLRAAAERFNLSARAYFRIIKVARTIADLTSVGEIQESHIAEAMQYRLGE